jgi:glycosyltransferase involved in cell wall biosynthesis
MRILYISDSRLPSERANSIQVVKTCEALSKYMPPPKMFGYMVFKRPIIASDLPSVREVLEDSKTALLANPDDPAHLAEMENRLIPDGSLCKRLSDAAFKLVNEKYTRGGRAERILDFLEKSLK